jgi:truncated hemoglobin YjbI
MPTPLERIGGPERLREIVARFVSRMVQDRIIGFLFEKVDLPRLITREAELAARHLGGDNAYSGRPLAAVHGPLRIHRGQFRRRLAVLEKILTEEGLPGDIIEGWVAHDRSLEALIAAPTDCGPPEGPGR